MIVEVLAIGTEMLLGQIVNTNASEIGARLADAGLDHYHQAVVGDNEQRIVAAIRLACSRADVLIITGGLGPTKDDLTRGALADAAGVPLAFDAVYADELRARWAARGWEMPESNLRQAEYPEGAALLTNPRGSAPGIRVEIDGTTVFALPGVPGEMLPMLDEHVIGTLRTDTDGVVVSRLVRTWGESEAKIGELLGDIYDDSRNPTIAFLASRGEIRVRITAKAATSIDAAALIAPVETEVRSRLGDRVYGSDADTIEVVVHRMLRERGWTIGTAESVTGGMIAERITSVPGASDVFRGSVVAYHEDGKTDLLGVAPDLIAESGVVSEPVAIAMAQGAAELLDVDVAIAITGSAGPDPQDQSVGTVVIAVRTPETTRVKTMRRPGGREQVRMSATTAALHLTRLLLEGVRWGND
jgi:nicotinamide-nucleotide amidase